MFRLTMCDDCTDKPRPLVFGVHLWVLQSCAAGLAVAALIILAVKR